MDFTNFRNHCLVNGKSKGSTETFIAKVELFFKSYTELNQANLDAFFASKIDIWKSGSTHNLFLNSLKHYAKFLKVELDFPKYHKVKKNPKEYLTEEEVNNIIFKIPLIFENPNKVKAIFLLMFSSGLRPKEVRQLKREDFDFQEKIVTIKDRKTHDYIKVALSNELAIMLPAIFAGEEEKINAFNITKDGLKYIFTRIKEMMGITIPLSGYTMRHSFAHDMLKKGVTLNELKNGMGHSSIKTTLGYLEVSEKESLEAIRKRINKRRKK
jgi:integrase/recombinase XerD